MFKISENLFLEHLLYSTVFGSTAGFYEITIVKYQNLLNWQPLLLNPQTFSDRQLKNLAVTKTFF